MKKQLGLLAKLAVMAGLLALLYRKVDFADFRAALAGLQWGWLPIIYVLLFVNTVLNSWKWGLLLRADGIRMSLGSLICSHLIGTFFNLFLPSSIGGDAYRVVDVGRRAHAGAKSFAAVFAERLMGFLALALWGLLFTAIGWARLPDPRILFLPVVVFVLMGALVFAVIQRTWLMAVWNFLRLNRARRLDAFLSRFLDSLAGYHADRKLVAVVFVLSLVFQMIAITTIFLISQALNWSVPFIFFCIFVPLITLGEALPISIFGIGVRDSLYVFFFVQGGATREEALAMALVYVLITLVYSLVGGVIFLLRRES
ncbi:MAG TPA: lysylphosphatidylglycerol synthase transmembrane domain-containing protein [Kiritimatiellia bacterium]|jgi:uncharacterized protein (TIRG00374 family)|nr:flippase-like domain-containing protein [Lentisphaerota bacterium]HRV31084.1 lysylphosphatidylglycerol synthase transmembrane domain-containing protein [Kiritimatiellia bacterium]